MLLFAFLLGLGITAGCGATTILPGSAPLASVAALETPKFPDWIEQISPLGEAEPQAQIRVRFKEPLIPVERLESKDQQDLLEKFELVPPLPGQFRFLTPRMVGFQADQATPKATRVQVRIKAGLQDLKQHRLETDLVWTFNTEPIKLSNLPTSNPDGNPNGEATETIDIKPVLKVTSNVELDLASLQEHTKLTAVGTQNSVSLKVALDESSQTKKLQPAERLDPSTRHWVYQLEPQQTLNKATRYTLEFTPGLRPAHGNLASQSVISSQVETYAPLAYKRLNFYGQPDASGAIGRFESGVAQLQFTNDIDAESAIANISINPAPKQNVPLVRTFEGDKAINLNPWALEPDTAYTITIAANLKDTFGQTLGAPVTVNYHTGNVSPDIWAPSGLTIFPAGKNLQLNSSTVNLSSYKSAFAVVQPTDLVYTDSAYPKENGSGLLPNPSNWQSSQITHEKNQVVEVAVPLQKQLGGTLGMLAYGIQARTNLYQDDKQQKWREPTIYGMVQLTNLGVFAQWFPQSGMVRVHHLSDGAAVENATVQIYLSKLEATDRPTPTPCATGKTDKAGILLFNRQALQTCMGGAAVFSEAPKLLAIAQEGKDWAFARTEEYSGSYGYGIDAGWQNGKPESRGTIFSDRQLYQPGETAWLTGAAYYLQSGDLKQDKKSRYSLTLEGPNGQKTDLGAQTTNEFGTFSLQVPLAQNQALGFYTVRAKGDSGNEIVGEFRVAEFKPPNFKVNLSLNLPGSQQPSSQTALPIALVNQRIDANLQSRYLFGAPVEGGKVQYYITRRRTEFTPPNWDEFSFGRRWFWPEEAPEVATDVLQTTQVIDGQGQSSQTVTVANDLPYPMRYRVDAQVSDVSNLSVADSKTFLALPSDRLIGLQADFVAEANKSFPVKVIVTDASGKPVLNQKVRLELQQMNYSRVTRLVEGSHTQQNQVEYKTVATADVNSDVQPQSVHLTAPNSGSYRIRAMIGDREDGSTADLQLWVTGSTPAYWGDRYRNNRLELKLDKKSYRPGEMATVLIQSPYPEADLYFAIARHNILYQSVTKVKGSAPQIQFPVTLDMLPNAAVEAVLVRQGAPLSQVEPGSLDKLVRIGFAPLTVGLDDRYLKLDITPALGGEGTTPAQPGSDQTIQLGLRDYQDKPVKGQFTVMVANEAVLQLTGYRPPDLVKTVYAEQPISTRFNDNRPNVVLQAQASPLEKGWGYGGGLSVGAANTRTRTNFKPLAHYATVVTDTAGKAEVKFKLPDDLTTWRILVVATDGELHFGTGDKTFVTSKPLVSNPVLPQFVRSGDRLQVGVSITNNTGQGGTLNVNGAVTEPLKLDNSSGSLQAQAGSGTSAYRFAIAVGNAGTAQVKFTTQLNGNTDGFEVPLEVKALAVTEQVVETGATTDQASIPIDVDKTVANDVGGLDISLASSLMPQLTAPVKQGLDQQDLPFLETSASQLAIAANLQILAQTYGQVFANFQPAEQAKHAIARLQTLQKPDGGFAYYPGQEKSDPFVTPYAVEAIAQASRVFPSSLTPSPSTLIPSLTAYLSKLLADPGQYEFCKQQLCKNQVRLETLIALAALGDRRSDFLADLYAQRDSFDPVQQIKLARYLSQFPDWQQDAKTMTNQLQESIYQTGRSATVNLPSEWRWLGSSTATQAEALRLLIVQQAKPELINRLLQGLLSLRRNGTWQSTYDNAVALTALVDYSKLQPTPPNFTAIAELAGKTLTTATFSGYRNPSTDLTVAIADLPRDRNTLVLKKSGDGILHYLVAYRYRLQGNQPGRLNGLRITRILRAANQEKVLYKTGLYAPEPLKLPVGQVYDVELEVITDHAVDHVVITDPLPAGFEAVDESFQTATPYFQAQGDSWQLAYRTIYKDRIVGYGDHLEPGVYTLHYLVRSVTPGTFLYPGAEVHLQYAAEEFGRSASSSMTIAE
jgi:uncharacterized protein YfaS (alpha-2-macroglobulin family)